MNQGMLPSKNPKVNQTAWSIVLILEQPQSTVALEGESVTLACSISDPTGSVTWIRNNLHIHNLGVDDSGTYTCIIFGTILVSFHPSHKTVLPGCT
uniref:Ig-like domain-containing protein n=1 Tax=Oryzias latipes TaxID=8090 RepID=A0A3P9KFH8_ORYLA